MEIINAVVEFVKAHWVEVLAIIGGIDLILGIIVKWTPAKWDDNIYTVIHNWLSKLVKK